jgi:hypothetical protein
VSPTARSLKKLRVEGAIADVVERRIPRSHITKDLFGFIDIVAIEVDGKGALGVQVTTVAHQAHRIAKVMAEPRARFWLEAGNAIAIYGWAKRGPRGKRKTWSLSETRIVLEDDRLCAI